MDFTHTLAFDVPRGDGSVIVPAGTKVQLRGSRREGGRETVLLRISRSWSTGGEFVTEYKPGLLIKIPTNL